MFSICSKIESKQMYLNWKHLWLKEPFSMKTSGCTFKSLPNKRMLESLFYATHGHPCRCSLNLFSFEVSTLFLDEKCRLVSVEWVFNRAAGVAIRAGHLAPRWRPDKGRALAGSQVDGVEAGVTTLGGQLKQLLTCEQSLPWCLLSASSGCRFLPCFSPSPFHRTREI